MLPRITLLIGAILFTIQVYSQTYDLMFPANSWRLASTPVNASNDNSQDLFPEAQLKNDLHYGFNRAQLAWYNVDPLFQRNNSSTPDYISGNDKIQRSHYARQINAQEIYPDFVSAFPTFNQNIFTFDLAFSPTVRGAYNFEHVENGSDFSAGVNADGSLKQPETRWGGVMRPVELHNFVAEDVEYIDFWLLDPFLENFANSKGGYLYFNIGSVSEDVMNDGRQFFENALPRPGTLTLLDTTAWGIVPLVPPSANAFENDPDVREVQDIGLDGMNDEQELYFYQSIADQLSQFLDTEALDKFMADPSSDNYRYCRDEYYDEVEAGIIERYQAFNCMQDNSPTNDSRGFSRAATNIPDTEDPNRDGILNREEAYYQYRIWLEPGMQAGDGFLTEVVLGGPNFDGDPARFLHFKVPITSFDDKIGDLDFTNISYMRMFLTGFEEDVILRFPRLELKKNELEPITDEIEASIYPVPNPTAGTLSFDLTPLYDRVFDESIINVEVYDVAGKLILSREQVYTVQYHIDLPPIANGEYLYKISVGEKTLNTGKFLLVK